MMTMLDHALRYHDENLCVIPVKPRDKMPLLSTWEEYTSRCSTRQEITSWWNNTPSANIGLVSGVNNFCMIDIDDDSGIFSKMKDRFAFLFNGRLEQSGSGAGYHIPLFLSTLPDLGYDNSKNRKKGNKTWKTDSGSVNIRARWAQAVTAPSIHPSGGVYHFIQEGDIVRAPDLTAVIAWLNEIDQSARIVTTRRDTTTTTTAGSLPIKEYFPSVLVAFRQLGYTDKTEPAQGGETRITGHGGLIVDADDKRWYCFSDETGGDVVDAFGWARFGQRWDRHNKGMFSSVMRDMEKAAGIGDTRALVGSQMNHPTFNTWGSKLRTNYWQA